MKRKFFLTVALSALFASSQLAFLAPVSAHPASQIRLSVASSSAVVYNGRVESVVSSRRVLTLGNSDGGTNSGVSSQRELTTRNGEGLNDIREFQAFVNASVQSIESFNPFGY